MNTREIEARDAVLARADAILIDAGVDPHEVERFSALKRRILDLVDGAVCLSDAPDPYVGMRYDPDAGHWVTDSVARFSTSIQ